MNDNTGLKYFISFVIFAILIKLFNQNIFSQYYSLNNKNYLEAELKNQKKTLAKLQNNINKQIINEIRNNTLYKQTQTIQTPPVIQPMVYPTIDNSVDSVYIRDSQVLNDKFYPPLGRTERPTFDILMKNVNDQLGPFNLYTQGPPDTYRILGYLTLKNIDEKTHNQQHQNHHNVLMLFGRAKYPNSDIGEFYVTPTNKISDIKFPLDNYNSNVKKITDVPYEVEIKGKLYPGIYDYTELPKSSLSYPYI